VCVCVCVCARERERERDKIVGETSALYSTEERQPRLLVLVSECNLNIAAIIRCEQFKDIYSFVRHILRLIVC